MYELVILTDKWLNAPGSPKKFDSLSHMLNKSYSKPMARFGIVQTKRVDDPARLRISLGLEKKEAFIILLLGSKELFARIEQETGWKREFDPNVWPLSRSQNSDIPSEYLSYFDELTPTTNVKITVPDVGADIEDDMLDRILASTGYKFHSARDPARVYELTAVTSFLSRMGSQLLKYANEVFLSDSHCPYLALESCPKVILRVVVIKEHLLVSYYERCGFKLTGEADLLFVPTDDPHSENLQVSRDIHWTFMEMEVDLD